MTVISSSTLIQTVAASLGTLADVFALRHVKRCVSTNTDLMDAPPEDNGCIHVLIADEQTGGKGRRGREWLSWPDGSLTFSLLWRFKPHAPVPAGLSLTAGVAVARAIERYPLSGIELKWPNDIMIHGRKLAGILVELLPQRGQPPAAVIGIGINLKLPEQTVIPGQPAVTDLYQALGYAVERTSLLANILLEMHQTFERYTLHGFPAIREAWEERNAFANLPVRISREKDEITGICHGVDQDGALLLTPLSGGKPIRILSGEVSLRGIV